MLELVITQSGFLLFQCFTSLFELVRQEFCGPGCLLFTSLEVFFDEKRGQLIRDLRHFTRFRTAIANPKRLQPLGSAKVADDVHRNVPSHPRDDFFTSQLLAFLPKQTEGVDNSLQPGLAQNLLREHSEAVPDVSRNRRPHVIFRNFLRVYQNERFGGIDVRKKVGENSRRPRYEDKYRQYQPFAMSNKAQIMFGRYGDPSRRCGHWFQSVAAGSSSHSGSPKNSKLLAKEKNAAKLFANRHLPGTGPVNARAIPELFQEFSGFGIGPSLL